MSTLDEVKNKYGWKQLNIAQWRDPRDSVHPFRGGPKLAIVSPDNVANPFRFKYKVKYKVPEPTDDEASSDGEGAAEEATLEPIVDSPMETPEPATDPTQEEAVVAPVEKAVTAESEPPHVPEHQVVDESVDTSGEVITLDESVVPKDSPEAILLVEDIGEPVLEAKIISAAPLDEIQEATSPDPTHMDPSELTKETMTFDESPNEEVTDIPLEIEVDDALREDPEPPQPIEEESVGLDHDQVHASGPEETLEHEDLDEGGEKKSVQFAPGTPEPKPTPRKKKSAKGTKGKKKKAVAPTVEEGPFYKVETIDTPVDGVVVVVPESEELVEPPSTDEHTCEMVEVTAPDGDQPVVEVEPEIVLVQGAVSDVQSVPEPEPIQIVETIENPPTVIEKSTKKSDKKISKSRSKKIESAMAVFEAPTSHTGSTYQSQKKGGRSSSSKSKSKGMEPAPMGLGIELGEVGSSVILMDSPSPVEILEVIEATVNGEIKDEEVVVPVDEVVEVSAAEETQSVLDSATEVAAQNVEELDESIVERIGENHGAFSDDLLTPVTPQTLEGAPADPLTTADKSIEETDVITVVEGHHHEVENEAIAPSDKVEVSNVLETNHLPPDSAVVLQEAHSSDTNEDESESGEDELAIELEPEGNDAPLSDDATLVIDESSTFAEDRNDEAETKEVEAPLLANTAPRRQIENEPTGEVPGAFPGAESAESPDAVSVDVPEIHVEAMRAQEPTAIEQTIMDEAPVETIETPEQLKEATKEDSADAIEKLVPMEAQVRALEAVADEPPTDENTGLGVVEASIEPLTEVPADDVEETAAATFAEPLVGAVSPEIEVETPIADNVTEVVPKPEEIPDSESREVEPDPVINEEPSTETDRPNDPAPAPTAQTRPSPTLSRRSHDKHKADHWQRTPSKKLPSGDKKSRSTKHTSSRSTTTDKRRRSSDKPQRSPEEEEERHRRRERKRVEKTARMLADERRRADEEELRVIREEAKRAARKAAAAEAARLVREEAEAAAKKEVERRKRRRRDSGREIEKSRSYRESRSFGVPSSSSKLGLIGRSGGDGQSSRRDRSSTHGSRHGDDEKPRSSKPAAQAEESLGEKPSSREVAPDDIDPPTRPSSLQDSSSRRKYRHHIRRVDGERSEHHRHRREGDRRDREGESNSRRPATEPQKSRSFLGSLLRGF